MHYAPATQNDSTTFPSLGAVDTADATGPSCRPLVACKPSVNPPNRAARVAFLSSSTWAGAVTSICRSRSSTFSNKRCFTLACTSGPLGFAASSSFNTSRNQESHRIARVASTSASGAASPTFWPVRALASRRSTRGFGSSASCTTISDISTWSRKP